MTTIERSAGLNTQGVLAMRSGGYYSERTVGAKQVIDAARPLVEAALEPRPGARPDTHPALRIADLGAADGGTSREMWAGVLGALRAAGDAREIVLTYTDLPSNDFSTLFRTMQGLQGDPAHALQERIEGLFVHACGTGFHRPLFPAGTLDLAFSATAMHYVSEKPCEITDHVHMVGASGSERAAFVAQAEADWQRILLARAHELCPGGRLVCLNFGLDAEGRHLGNTGGVSMFDAFERHWRALRDAGRITPREYVRATFAQAYRTRAEFVAPLSDPASPVHAAGLRLVSAHETLTRCPFAVAFEAAAGAMSAREYAKTLIPTMRSWSETVFSTALDPRPPAEAQAIVDDFYQAYEDEVAADPAGHAMDYVHIVLVVEKVGLAGGPA